MKILDATCGTKAMWYKKNHPLVTYLDIRKGNFICQKKSNGRKTNIKINPDIVGDFTDLDFSDNYFDMILFDPPHLIRKSEKNMEMAIRYGYLHPDNWKQILKKGIDELFRVLKPNGVFIFKWSETQKSIKEIINLFPYKPIFGNRNRNNPKSNDTYWIVFLKYDVNKKLIEAQT